MKKLISFIVSICMVITLIPTFAFALDNNAGVDQMDGTQPEQISEEYDASGEATLGEGSSEEGTVPGDEDMSDPLGDDPVLDQWQQDAEGHWLYYVDGTPVTGLYTVSGSNKYYFNASGYMQTGWQTINGAKYYFKTAGSNPKIDSLGAMHTGWLVVNGAKYYLNPKTGKRQTGWLKLNDRKYRLDTKTGKVKTGWFTLKKNKYYLQKADNIANAKYGAACVGLSTVNGVRYYFSSYGVMKTGLIKVSGTLYFFRTSGKSKGKAQPKGWFKYKKKQRYCYGKGKLATGTAQIKGIWYVFNSGTGALIRKIGDTVDKEIQNKYSSTRYLIVVVKSDHKVRIYTGKKKSWKRQNTWWCTIGKKSTPTYSGDYTIYTREEFQQNTSKTCRWWYCTHFTGRLFFQSILYDANPIPGKGKIIDGRLGVSVSDGAVRLSLANAKWIYTTIPNGTKVVVR